MSNPITLSITHLLTYRESAQLLGLAEGTLRIWVSAGRIPYTKLGKSVRFTPEQIEAIIHRGAVNPK